MGSTTVLHNQMSAITRTRMKEQCDFLQEAHEEGSFVKTNLMGRVVAGLNCLALHAEFFARCITMLSLMAINTVTKFKPEQIKIQREQSFAALRTSVLCFTILFQPEMLQHLKGWLAAQPAKELESQDDLIEEVVASPVSKVARPAAQPRPERLVRRVEESPDSSFGSPIDSPEAFHGRGLFRSNSGSLLAQGGGLGRVSAPSIFQMLKPPHEVFPSEQGKLETAKKSAQQQKQALQEALKPRNSEEVKTLLAAALQQAQQQKKWATADLSHKTRTLTSLKEKGWGSYTFCGKGFAIEATTFKKMSGSEIQHLHQTLKIHDGLGVAHDFLLVGLFEPQTGPRASLYLKGHLGQFLSEQLRKLSTKGMSEEVIWNACTRASFELQADFLAKNQEERLHERLLPFAEDCSAMTAVLMGKEAIYILNLGNSNAVLNNGGKYVPLTADADPALKANEAQVKAMGGYVEKGLVDGKLNAATIFGGASLHGSASSICKITRVLRSEIQPNSQLFLGSSSVFKITDGQSIVNLLAGIKSPDSLDPFVYAENALYSVITHAGPRESGDVACMVLGFNQLQELEEDRSVATPSTPLSSITRAPDTARSGHSHQPAGLPPRSESTFLGGSALFSSADLAAMAAPRHVEAASAERSPGLPPRADNSTFLGSAIFSATDLAAMAAPQHVEAASAERSPGLPPRADNSSLLGSALFSSADLAAMNAAQHPVAAEAGSQEREFTPEMGARALSPLGSEYSLLGSVAPRAQGGGAESRHSTPEMVERPASVHSVDSSDSQDKRPGQVLAPINVHDQYGAASPVNSKGLWQSVSDPDEMNG